MSEVIIQLVHKLEASPKNIKKRKQKLSDKASAKKDKKKKKKKKRKHESDTEESTIGKKTADCEKDVEEL
jgi:hypothetical protein